MTVPYIMTASGKKYVIDAPTVDMVDVDDICAALSRIKRFTGHVDYSVAQHSIAVCEIAKALGASPVMQLAAALHDASEAYLGDISTPVKQLLGPEYRALEDKAHSVIGEKFGIDGSLFRDGDIKRFDELALLAESLQFFGEPFCDIVASHREIAIAARITSRISDISCIDSDHGWRLRNAISDLSKINKGA